MSFEPNTHILLTGAGFSYPFGGRLAREFRSSLFNRTQVQARPKLKGLLLSLREKNFEDAIAMVRSSTDFNAEDIGALESAVLEVFISMDAAESQHAWRDGEVGHPRFEDFLKRFECPAWGGDGTGFLFTLNQDLLLERNWYNFRAYGPRPVLPGIPPAQFEGRTWFSPNVPAYSDQMEVVIPQTWDFNGRGYTNYVKLHGSMNWRTADGDRALVVGTGKPDQIARLPLLAAYSDLFKEVLMTPNRRLMVVGYSFQDTHINELIDLAAKESGLRVDIWDPYVDGIVETISKRAECSNIIGALQGLWFHRMHEVFPASQDVTAVWHEMQEKFFDR